MSISCSAMTSAASSAGVRRPEREDQCRQPLGHVLDEQERAAELPGQQAICESARPSRQSGPDAAHAECRTRSLKDHDWVHDLRSAGGAARP